MVRSSVARVLSVQQLDPERLTKWAQLHDLLVELGSVVVAFSGGVDSSLLAVAAFHALGDRMIAVTVHSPVEVPGDSQAAQELAAKIGFAHQVVEFNDLEEPAFVRNPPERCYVCKRRRMATLQTLARQMGFAQVVDGSNADDMHEYRPGLRALAELGVRSPLAEVGLAKADVRALAHALGMPVWDRPSAPCLATRFPYGTPITAEALGRLGQAEGFLKGQGYEPLRVRLYESMVRIEVAGDSIPRLVAERELIVARLKALGFTHISLDLAGYRSGSMDEVLRP